MVPLGKKRFYLYIISMVKHVVSLRDKDSDKCIASVYPVVLPWCERANSKKIAYINPATKFGAPVLPQGIFDAIYRYIL